MYIFLATIKLKNELSVIRSREDIHNADGAVALLQHFIESALESVFEESTKLLKIVCIIPMTSVESQRFASINKVKTFTHNTMTQDRSNAPKVHSAILLHKRIAEWNLFTNKW